MTDILLYTIHDFVPQQSNYQKDIEHLLKLNQIIYTITSTSTIQFLIPFSQLNSENKIHSFYQYFLLSTIQTNPNMFSIKSTIIDDNGMNIKARSIQQKTFLIKFSMFLSKKNGFFQIKVHPITGQIQLQYFFCVLQNLNFSQIVYLFLNNCQKKSEAIFEILQCLEQKPMENPQNSFYNKLLQKIEPIRPLLINSNSPFEKKQSQQQNLHQKYFGPIERLNIKINKTANMNVLERMRKIYVEQHLSSFVKNSSKIKQNNLSYLVLDDTPAFRALLKSMETQDILSNNETEAEKFTSQGRSINMSYHPLEPEVINYQYLIADKIIKKKNFLTFVKQYLIPRNRMEVSKFYLLTKKFQEPTQPLKKFMQKNRLTMSFQTKLSIILQLISIACVCMQQIQNYNPNLNLQNILITRNMQLKMNSLYKSKQCPKMCLFQSIYYLLFTKTYYFYSNQNQFIKYQIINLSNQELKYIGPSIVVKILIKLLQNFQADTDKCRSFQNLLLGVNRIVEGYQTLLSMHQQAES